MIGNTRAKGRSLTFSLDSVNPSGVQSAFDRFGRAWQGQVGCAAPSFNPTACGDFACKAQVTRVSDVVIIDVREAVAAGASGGIDAAGDQVRLYVVDQGAWAFREPRDRSDHNVTAGQFLVRHVRQPPRFETEAYTTAKVLVLPPGPLVPLLSDRIVTGAVESAEIRLLRAHTNMVHATAAELGPAGVDAAHSTTIELVKAVLRQGFDDAEPALAGALAQAAKDLADRRLADPELSATMLAGELNVSVRTLQRAFASAEEPVAAYIRRRRLEEARIALTSSRMTVSELAAYWHFADNSHFTRAFKKLYGRTPTDYARDAKAEPPQPAGVLFQD